MSGVCTLGYCPFCDEPEFDCDDCPCFEVHEAPSYVIENPEDYIV